jgi:hypothetical protein
VPAPEWEALFQRTDAWTGGDGAATVVVGDRVLWLFADSWIGPVVDGKHGPNSALVNNALAIHPVPARGSGTPPDPGTVSFYWGLPTDRGKPTAWLKPDRPGDWFWPAGGAVLVPAGDHGRLFIFLSRLRRRDSSSDIWNFQGIATDVVWTDRPGDTPDRWLGPQWTLCPTPLPRSGRKIAWGAGALLEGDRALVFGVDSTDGLNKKLLLARAPGAEIHRFELWRFHSADGWRESVEDAGSVAQNIADEFSVHWVALGTHRRLVLIYSEPGFGHRILARTAEKPEGPWSEPVPIYTCPEPGRDERLFVYGAKAHPELSKGGELLVSYCVNSHDFWHMAGDADIYRPRFIRVPLSMLEGARPAGAKASGGSPTP